MRVKETHITCECIYLWLSTSQMGIYVCVICLVKYMCIIYIQDALSDPETLPSLCRR